jgi:hypothetical protein
MASNPCREADNPRGVTSAQGAIAIRFQDRHTELPGGFDCFRISARIDSATQSGADDFKVTSQRFVNLYQADDDNRTEYKGS